MYPPASILHLSDDMTLSEFVTKTVPKGKDKGQPKGKQESRQIALDQSTEDQPYEMYRVHCSMRRE